MPNILFFLFGTKYLNCLIINPCYASMHFVRITFGYLVFGVIITSCQYENAEQLYYKPPIEDNDTLGLKKTILALPFNGSIEDENDEPKTVISYGSPQLTHDRFDNPNNALLLNGTDQYIEIELGQQDSISISFWFNCGSGRSNLSSLFDYGANAVKTNIDGYSGPTTFNVTAFYNNLDELNTDYYFRYYEWYHIYVSACKNPVIYVNGEKAGQIIKNILLNLASEKMIIGKSITGANENDVYFQGVIDDIIIYNYALSSLEINQLYATGNNTIKD